MPTMSASDAVHECLYERRKSSVRSCVRLDDAVEMFQIKKRTYICGTGTLAILFFDH